MAPDGGPKIPDWQRQTEKLASHSSPSGKQQMAADSDNKNDQSKSSELTSTAWRFLQDPAVKDASRAKKESFLQEKGLDARTIELLLDSEESTRLCFQEAWPDVTCPAPIAPKKTQKQEQGQGQAEHIARFASKVLEREVPPIVTYPEFLAAPIRPPPLVTLPRLLKTAYGIASVGAVVYGASRFLVSPMIEHLTGSRHELAAHTTAQLEELNESIASLVSTVPQRKTPLDDSKTADSVSDGSTVDSDPTELFHRDAGTQTSPEVSRRASASSVTSPTSTRTNYGSTISRQATQIKILQSHLTEIVEDDNKTEEVVRTVSYQTERLTSYLNDVSSNNTSSLYGTAPFGFAAPEKKESDAIAALKADIRSVKGIFLSARNFPSGGRALTRAGR